MGSGWSTPRPGRFTPGIDPVPIVQETGWAPGPVWMGVERLAPTGIRSPDLPARSESLYRLSYCGTSGLVGKLPEVPLPITKSGTENNVQKWARAKSKADVAYFNALFSI